MTEQNNRTRQDDFMTLYGPLHERLSRFVQSMVWHREDARDVISETVLAAYESFHKVKNRGAFLYYLFGIASRLAKKRDRRKKFFGVFDPSSAGKLVSQLNSSSRAEASDLYAALNKLPVKQREAIILFEISGFSIKEIADLQGSSLSGVKSRLTRGRESLVRLLRDEPVVFKSGISVPTGSTLNV